MTPTQREALERLMKGATGLRSTTARELHRAGLIEPDGDYWVITAAGRRYVERVRYECAHRAAYRQLTEPDRQWGRRVAGWLTATSLDIEPRLLYHLEHLAACHHRGIDPGPQPPEYAPLDWAEAFVRAAARCLRDLDAEIKVANERDVGITVRFEADPPVPRARHEATAAAARPDGVVELSTYRARRPAPA